MELIAIDFTGKIIKGRFLERLNRFLAYGQIKEEKLLMHIPNTGRMRELLIKGAEILCKKSENPNRKTVYSIIAVNTSLGWMAIDSSLPNKLVAQALKLGIISDFNNNYFIKPEIEYKNSRFDIGLTNSRCQWLIEVKCCTHVKEGVGRFPDAPTVRGTRHMNELRDAVQSGLFNCALFFVVQCSYAHSFSPNDDTDPKFGKALRQAYESGVKIYAFNCKISEKSINLWTSIPIIL